MFQNIRFGKSISKVFKNKKTKVIVKNSFSHEKLYEELFSIDEIDCVFDEHGFYVIKDKINKNKSKNNRIKTLYHLG